MPQYRYTAQNSAGKRQSGTASAASENDLHQQLRDSGLYLLSCEPLSATGSQRQLKPKALAEFCRQLGTLLQAGVPLARALSIVAQGESIRPRERKIYEELISRIRQGVSLTEAMELMDGAFPPLMIHMLRAAENSGNIDAAAQKLADLFEKEHRTRRKVSSALTYPKLLLVMIIGVILLLANYIMPRLSTLFENLDTLPTSTKILLKINELLTNHWLWLLAGILCCVAAAKLLMTLPKFRCFWHRFCLHLPVFGNLQKIICTARFARSLSGLYSAGLPIVPALQIARKTAGNDYIDGQFDRVISYVRAGNNLSDALALVDGFTRKLADAARIGEETGKLDEMLTSTAESMEYDSDVAMNKLVSYVEPIMLIVMGVIVAFILIGVFQAIYGSYNSMLNI